MGPESANVAAIYRSIRRLSTTHILSATRSLTHLPDNTREVSITPRNHGEAMASAQASEWRTSMEKELAIISKHGVYKLGPARKGRKTIGAMWVFKLKPDGLCKSRFCAQGFPQVDGTDYGSTYAPVYRIPSVRIVLAIAARHDWLECDSARCTDIISSE